jgi:(2R)-3-sulfolactate dehydrogenase (NADP+)
MPVITFDMLNDRVTARLVEAGAAGQHARIVAESLLYAEASGLLSHGLIRLPFLLDQTRTGKIDGTAVPELRTTGSGLLLCDARGGQCPRKWWISDRRDSRVMINESC